MKIRNIFIIFIVSGFWHGANWTFIAWGALNALFFLPLLLLKRNRNNMEVVAEGRWFPPIKDFFSILFTFSLTVLTWIFFRAESIEHAKSIFSGIFSESLFNSHIYSGNHKFTIVLMLLAFFIIVEWLGREGQYAIAHIKNKLVLPVRWIFYSFIIFTIGMFMKTQEAPFIYFQF